ncbi:MAG TPA: caspase family protein [Kofleriaceae bacterium]
MTTAHALVALGVALAAFGPARPATAEVVRYAVLVGEDHGSAGERPLRFAETDAERLAEVLADLGDLAAENQVLLRGKGAGAARRAIITVNDRIRTTRRDGDVTVLIVYYSGHADASALHMSGERLELRELEALVRGSPADVRLLIIDACRSGAITRVKGGHPAPPVSLDEPLLGEGLVFLTSSAAGEDAQEADEIGGSFFTHFLVSGLLGAADTNGDGDVALAEAFEFAREQTIMASSRTLAGTQHPTFRYELRGRGDITLTRLGAASKRATLTLPAGLAWLVIADDAQGRVVAEADAARAPRLLSLRPGRYFVRGRGATALYEGSVRLDHAQTIELASLDRIAYARLVRKGGAARVTDGPVAAAVVRSRLVAGEQPCLGALAGWSWELPAVTLSPRLELCRSTLANVHLTSTTYTGNVELRVSHAWDLPVVTVDLGASVAGGMFRQSYETAGVAPPRTISTAHIDASIGASVNLQGPVYLWLEAALQTYFFRLDQNSATSLVAEVASRGLIGIGLRR